MIIAIDNKRYAIGLTWFIADSQHKLFDALYHIDCQSFVMDVKRNIAAAMPSNVTSMEVVGAISLAGVLSELLAKDAIYIFRLFDKEGHSIDKYWLCAVKNGVILPTVKLPVNQELISQSGDIKASNREIELSGDMIVDEASLYQCLRYLERIFSADVFRQIIQCDTQVDNLLIDKIALDFAIDRKLIKRNALAQLLINIKDKDSRQFVIKALPKRVKKVDSEPVSRKASVLKSRRKLISYGVLSLVLATGGYMYFSNNTSSKSANNKDTNEIKLQQEKAYIQKVESDIQHKNAYPLIIKFVNAIGNLPTSALQWHIQKVSYQTGALDDVSVIYVLNNKKHKVALTKAAFNNIQSLQAISVTEAADNMTNVLFKLIHNAHASTDQSIVRLKDRAAESYRFNQFVEELKLRGIDFKLIPPQSAYGVAKHGITVIGHSMRELISLTAIAKALNTFVLVNIEIQNNQDKPVSWIVKGEIYEA
ncbi:MULTISPECIES: hypothetical protein [Cysteiniphilum]|uniref:Uncharacterized protein n=1 Tax=Cysteiniphilum litorale TaxID=2056700 RepID=A0A8J3E965_9GAMM|nr:MULTISPECIES: hypothetical protein [Cysteiniphilum]GGG01062.1 hypothetical protein GCM10010995_18120 [Cysteiniphilum litorale]